MATVSQRRAFKHDGRVIYEWEQSMEEVNVFIKPPPGVTAQQIQCDITTNHVTLGRCATETRPRELRVVVESYWMLDSGELNINLQKMKKGFIWPRLRWTWRVGSNQQEATKQQMMLERFQEENPGFDFSNAEFNGAAPDPRTFMGGVKYTLRLLRRGWKETTENDWDFYWADREYIYELLDTVHLENSQRVNHYRMGERYFVRWENTVRSQLSYTALLSVVVSRSIKNLKRAKRQMDKKARSEDATLSELDMVLGSYDFFPVTYILPGEYAIFVEEFKRNQGVWIMKPIGKAQGKGIFLFTKLSQISDWRTDFAGGLKTNRLRRTSCSATSQVRTSSVEEIRFASISLVSSFFPLEIYLFRGGFARFTNSRYSNNHSDIANSFIHLTNVAVQKPPRTITSSVEKIIMNDKHCFELYGYDIMIDENLKPWLLEVNASPSLKCGMLNDMLDIIDLENRKPEGVVQEHVGGFDLVYRDGNVTKKNEGCMYTTFWGRLAANALNENGNQQHAVMRPGHVRKPA
ncbi:putative tubulin polyglutamylase TTLL9 [Phytophthora cactorum]|nr:putative tubulin polyglutamylase TTLL9 [Phytophthora cactorum]